MTAQRPSLSADTATTAVGTVEIESGVAWDPDDFFDTPASLKYGASSTAEVFFNLSPYKLVEMPGRDEEGLGDFAVGFRHRFREETRTTPSAAVQTIVKIPTANESDGLGSGEFDASVAGIVTKGLGDYSVTGFYSLDLIGSPSGGADLGHSLAIASSTPAFDQIGIFGELAAVLVPERDSEQLFSTWGLTISPRPSQLFDIAVVLGLSDEAPDFQLLFGFTTNLGDIHSH